MGHTTVAIIGYNLQFSQSDCPLQNDTCLLGGLAMYMILVCFRVGVRGGGCGRISSKCRRLSSAGWYVLDILESFSLRFVKDRASCKLFHRFVEDCFHLSAPILMTQSKKVFKNL